MAGDLNVPFKYTEKDSSWTCKNTEYVIRLKVQWHLAKEKETADQIYQIHREELSLIRKVQTKYACNTRVKVKSLILRHPEQVLVRPGNLMRRYQSEQF